MLKGFDEDFDNAVTPPVVTPNTPVESKESSLVAIWGHIKENKLLYGAVIVAGAWLIWKKVLKK